MLENTAMHLNALFNENGFFGCDASHIVLQPFRNLDSDVHFIVESLGKALTDDDDIQKNCNRIMAKEGIAGSAPLLLLEQILGLDANGNLVGRWKDDFWKSQDPRFFWPVNDVDCFIIADNSKEFQKRVKVIIERMATVLKECNKRIIIKRQRKCRYVQPDTSVSIVDCKISEVEPTLSFVHAKGCSSMKEVIGGFDQ